MAQLVYIQQIMFNLYKVAPTLDTCRVMFAYAFLIFMLMLVNLSYMYLLLPNIKSASTQIRNGHLHKKSK